MNGIGIESSEYREEERGRILLLGVRHSNRDWVFEENGVARDMPRRGNRNIGCSDCYYDRRMVTLGPFEAHIKPNN